MRPRKVPREARRLRTYAELQSYLSDFVRGIYPFLWLVGRPGVGKSESITDVVRGRAVYYRKGGQLTPLQFYKDCYEHRNQPIILDDAEDILKKAEGRRVVCSLGDTTRVKQLDWGSTTRALGEVPRTYHTSSSLCIIANSATTHEAIQSRAVTLYFDPTSLEVHRASARWFWDQEIHDWVGGHLYRLEPLEARWYSKAANDKRGGRGWRQILLTAHALNRPACIVQDLETDPSYPTTKDKERRFEELIGGKGKSRPTYHRIRARLIDAGQLHVEAVPPIRLRRTRPPGPASELELESLAAPAPAAPEPEPGPLDLPAHAAFQQPITGGATAAQAPAGPALDDSVSWEAPPPQDDDGEEDEGPNP
jgi:hypothetical protein